MIYKSNKEIQYYKDAMGNIYDARPHNDLARKISSYLMRPDFAETKDLTPIAAIEVREYNQSGEETVTESGQFDENTDKFTRDQVIDLIQWVVDDIDDQWVDGHIGRIGNCSLEDAESMLSEWQKDKES